MAYLDDSATQKANLNFIAGAMKTPLLSPEHERDLARAWKDQHDEKALHELVTAHHRLVVALAHKFRAYGLPLGDLIQEGVIGLLEAANRFDPDRQVRFSTYATWWIRSTIQDYILRNWSIVRTGTSSAQKSLFFNLRRLRARIETASGPALSSDEKHEKIAHALNIEPKNVAEMEMRLSSGDQSLNAPVGNESEEEWIALLPDTRPTPEDIVSDMKDAAARSAWLSRALSALPAREQTIIRSRHLEEQGVTLEALSGQLGISKERVRQLEERAMEKLRGHLSTNWTKDTHTCL